jgi:hypothetical protein
MARSLTKTDKKTGAVYTRPQIVESDIDEIIVVELPLLRTRLLITDRPTPGYVRSECLVHLLRDAHRANDQPRRDLLLVTLLGRCEAILLHKISPQLPNAETLREDILAEFSELLIADGFEANSNELDFYECKFNLAFRTMYIDALRRECDEINSAAALPDDRDEEEPPGPYEDALARVSQAMQVPATQQGALFLNELWTAINTLPTDERRAVILCHVLGYDEESDDPAKVTAATLCGCTGRTIRNRLTRAAAKLTRFKEDA